MAPCQLQTMPGAILVPVCKILDDTKGIYDIESTKYIWIGEK